MFLIWFLIYYLEKGLPTSKYDLTFIFRWFFFRKPLWIVESRTSLEGQPLRKSALTLLLVIATRLPCRLIGLLEKPIAPAGISRLDLLEGQILSNISKRSFEGLVHIQLIVEGIQFTEDYGKWYSTRFDPCWDCVICQNSIMYEVWRHIVHLISLDIRKTTPLRLLPHCPSYPPPHCIVSRQSRCSFPEVNYLIELLSEGCYWKVLHFSVA